MRFILTIVSCCVASLCVAQVTPKSLRIQISYEKSGKYLEQAVETIVAFNHIKPTSVVDYQAGSSITLSPGFLAYNGSTFTAEIKPIENRSEFTLELKAYPNPFEQSTVINFTLPEAGKINLVVVDEKGQIIERLLENSSQSAGQHTFEWKPQALSSGIYIPILKTDRQQVSSRLIKN
ncbi:T9SS type A sorting domain-containing protein [Spirosoma gilvum]